MNPFCQFAVAASVEAMEDAGLVSKIDPERLGVYFQLRHRRSVISVRRIL